MAKTWERPKDPNEVLDYDLTWEAQMTADGDTIDTSNWMVPAGITKDSQSNTTTRTKVWLSGGTTGQTYELLNHVVTAGGREFDQTMKLKMKDR